jgi:anti-sigma factor RsiW
LDQNIEQLIIRYLMGELDPANRRQFEEAYFDDDRFFSRLLEAEEKLIQEYAAGALSTEDRERFERRFLTCPTRRHRVESAKSEPNQAHARTPVDIPPAKD